MVEQGKSIIFITHKLGEVMDIADRITVIRSGKVVGSTTPAESSLNDLASMMVGREVSLEVEKTEAKPGEVIFSIQDLKVLDPLGAVAVDDMSFQVHAGEVLGIAGVQGNGQTELVRAITGLEHAIEGEVRFLGKNITKLSPRKITEIGSAHIPEDRQKDGLVLSFPISDNLVLNTYYLAPNAKAFWMDYKQILDNGKNLVENFDIRTPSPMIPVSNLSGGNQQKVIVAREFSRPIKFLVASQPTRGLDVGSIEYIHKQLIQKRDEGCAILLVSTELDEVMQLSDRIAVVYRGKVLDILDAKSASKELVGLLMAGIIPSEEEKKKMVSKKKQILMT